jgi:hypothetical protein
MSALLSGAVFDLLLLSALIVRPGGKEGQTAPNVGYVCCDVCGELLTRSRRVVERGRERAQCGSERASFAGVTREPRTARGEQMWQTQEKRADNAGSFREQ